MLDLDKEMRRVRKIAADFSRPYRIDHGRKFRLKDHSPGDTGGLDGEDRPAALEALGIGRAAMAELQDRLYAQDRWSVLLIFQAMDAAGKDSAIKHVMSGINPQGCQVFSFKAPTTEELDHDYMWRCAKSLPERGRIGIFNRSYYEEVLVVKVHREILAGQRMPASLVTRDIWDQRYEDIRSFERYLARNGTIVRKFFLNVSRGEQKKRFMERIREPDKNWTFSATDAKERAHWDAYMDAYETMIRETSTPESPWYVVPADNKWYTRLVVAGATVDAMASLDLAYPALGPKQLAELDEARRILEAEDGKGGQDVKDGKDKKPRKEKKAGKHPKANGAAQGKSHGKS